MSPAGESSSCSTATTAPPLLLVLEAEPGVPVGRLPLRQRPPQEHVAAAHLLPLLLLQRTAPASRRTAPAAPRGSSARRRRRPASLRTQRSRGGRPRSAMVRTYLNRTQSRLFSGDMEISVIFGLINGLVFIVFTDAVLTTAVGQWTELGDARARVLTRLQNRLFRGQLRHSSSRERLFSSRLQNKLFCSHLHLR